jgi:thiamine-phosphate pyrophosphorylase
VSAPLARLWLCADVDHRNAPSIVARVRAVIREVPASVWLRSPHGWSARALLEVAWALREHTHRTGSALFVGDRLDVATLVGADGVHLPERAFLPSTVRASSALRVSVATHDARGVTAAAPYADVLVASPFGALEGKGAALGREGFAALRALAPTRPFVALGGIVTADDARAAIAAGADGVAVRRALLDASDPLAACAEIARALPSGWLTERADGANTSRDA